MWLRQMRRLAMRHPARKQRRSADAFCRNLFLEAVAFLRFFDAAGCCWGRWSS